MNLRATLVVLLVFCLSAHAQERARLSVTEILEPETRLRAFQEFCLRTDHEEAKEYGWADLGEFADWHRDITVSALRRGEGAPRYLLTWDTVSGSTEGWSKVDALANSSAPAITVLPPRDGLRYQIFSADGLPLLKEEGYISDGQIADLNGDGEPEVIERVASSTGGGVPGLTPDDSGVTGEIESEYLQVRPPDINAKASFAILYNTHPKERALGNTWGFQLRDTDGDGLFEIELGPLLAPAGVEPKVAFRWDKAKRAWTGPEPKNGDHFRVLQGSTPDDLAERIVKKGGLGYPLAPAPELARAKVELPERPHDADSIPPERLSKPYLYQSLKDASNEQILAFMAERRRAWDYVTDRMREASAVADFWQLDPKAAALQYVQRNRPPATATRHLLSFYNPANETAPEEGGLTLSDGPSGCFAPGGAYIHHLHCARDGSYLTYVEVVEHWNNVLPTENPTRFDFRKLALPYDEARHLLQTVWWMSRIRSRQLTSGGGADFVSGGSSSDGFATVQIDSGELNVVVSDSRSAGHGGTFLGVGEMSEGYEPSAFINLVVQLLRREVPERLGQPWKTQDMSERWNGNIHAPSQHPPETLARVKKVTVELLCLFRERKLAPGAALQAIYAVGEMGWQDLRADVEAIAQLLPPLFDHEKRLTETREELKNWKDKLGAEAEEKAFSERQGRRFALRHPTLNSHDETKPQPFSPEEEAKYAEVDALYESLSRIEYRVPAPEREIADLRSAIPVVLRKLEVFNNAEQIHRWALEDKSAMSFALARLAVLDPERAIELLRRCEAEAEDPQLKDRYLNARRSLEGGDSVAFSGADATPLSSEERGKALVTLRDPKAHYGARQSALTALVPAHDPKRHSAPEIDAALLELLTREEKSSGVLPEGIPMAAAQRLGGKAWESLVTYAQSTKFIGIPRLRESLPALTLIAQAEPVPYRTKLREILAAELDSTHGFLDQTLWSLWQLDLRELKPRLEQIATGGPQDYEGTRATGGSNHRLPVTNRFHRARQIAALWNEEDPLTRAKLHVAFAVVHAREFAEEATGALTHLQKQIATLRPSLSSAQEGAIVEFAQWCEANAAAKLSTQFDPAKTTSVLQSVRSSF